MDYRLAIIGVDQARLDKPILREWLTRGGFKVWSGYGPRKAKEDVWFGYEEKKIPPGVPLLALGEVALALTGYELPLHKIRGSLLPYKKGWLTVGLDPEDVGFGSGHLKPLLGADARRAVDNPTPIIPQVKFFVGAYGIPPIPHESIVSVDIEGANGKPNIVGVCWDTTVAYVVNWTPGIKAKLGDIFHDNYMPTFHNAAFDVAELQEAGVQPPNVWYDTINIAALYDPEQLMNLQAQVLTHVPGSVTWKGLIDHEKGPDYDGGSVGIYRSLWRDVLSRMEVHKVPRTGQEWYAFYNGLDTAWGLALVLNLQDKLERQERWAYYEEVMMPLQRPLIEIGNRGMPCDEDKIEEHRVECLAKMKTATETLVQFGRSMLEDKLRELEFQILTMEAIKLGCKERGVNWEGQKDLTALKAKAKRSTEFNPDSAPQRAALLYEWYGLPPVKNYGAKGYTTDDTAIKDLLSRLERGTIKPKRGTKEEVTLVLNAMMDAKKWGTLERTFLHPELR